MPQIRKKRKFELGRPAAMTKIMPRRVHQVRTMGGNRKFRALRLDHGNFSWGSEGRQCSACFRVHSLFSVLCIVRPCMAALQLSVIKWMHRYC